ncbi:cytochrome-c peroxidase [Pokkaliibacter plantistimulans]|uniref:Cytochrome-c peroxidase n=1 Tax=Proteobacteria bacterium 228 TaxID=2083153 RepID=A0A2S5KUH0_9PROT|nr:cytochrome c peroxidase [Pokkaliibacter plantistimulans]PPC78501.1 cytochrome-c peroxidase [Pokkaliibacter plantistimulans]
MLPITAQSGFFRRRQYLLTAVLALLIILVFAAVMVTTSPVPWQLWWQSPRQAYALARGYNPFPQPLTVPASQPLSAMAQLGQQLFFDPSLSGSGQLSCASCHSPSHAYGPASDDAVVKGGIAMQQRGFRAVPSLAYLYRQPLFNIGPDLEGDDDQVMTLQQQAEQATTSDRAVKRADSTALSASNLVPMGGLFWDGRVDTLQQQASGPLFNPVEMAAQSPATVARALQQASYADRFRALFGAHIFDNPQQTVAEAMFALARFQTEDSSFHPFTSQFDAWLQGNARMTPAQIRGYLAFNDPRQGNCAACHLDKPGKDGLPPLLTDFQYEALGVPRNAAIPANADPSFHDLGLCGPFRQDLQQQTQYCGMFLTPSLRNSATRRVFFHNGVFHTLEQVLNWYVNRDLHPSQFYATGPDGKAIAYDDLPRQYVKNVDVSDAPLDRHPGDRPALDAEQIKDVVAFLGTLTDGYTTSK